MKLTGDIPPLTLSNSMLKIIELSFNVTDGKVYQPIIISPELDKLKFKEPPSPVPVVTDEGFATDGLYNIVRLPLDIFEKPTAVIDTVNDEAVVLAFSMVKTGTTCPLRFSIIPVRSTKEKVKKPFIINVFYKN